MQLLHCGLFRASWEHDTCRHHTLKAILIFISLVERQKWGSVLLALLRTNSVDTDVCCLVGRAVFNSNFSIEANYRGQEGFCLQAVLFVFLGLCTNCAEDVKMLWMALYKSAWFWWDVIPNWVWWPAYYLRLKPSCPAGSLLLEPLIFSSSHGGITQLTSVLCC